MEILAKIKTIIVLYRKNQLIFSNKCEFTETINLLNTEKNDMKGAPIAVFFFLQNCHSDNIHPCIKLLNDDCRFLLITSV